MANLLLAGGGTAGHVNPLLATAEELRARGHHVEALGTASGLEQDLVPRAGLTLHEVPKVPMPRRPSGDLLRFPSRFNASVRAARRAIDASAADAVVGFGGYVSTPAYIAARRAGVPIVVHEANVRPGMANKLGARMTSHVAVTFANTPLRGATLTGLPLRSQIRDLAHLLADPDRAAQARDEARSAAGWPPDAPVLVITGGSLGAASLNAAAAQAVPALIAGGIHVWHLTGKGKADEAKRVRDSLAPADQARYRVEEYSHDMSSVLAAAGAVVCRAGAATVCELSALGLPAMYVPLPHGNGEQAENALPAVEAGAALMIHDAELTATSLVARAQQMLLDRAVGAAMKEAARDIGIPDGAQRLADLIEGALR